MEDKEHLSTIEHENSDMQMSKISGMGLPKNLLTGANYSRFILRTSPPSFGHNCGEEGGIRCDPIYVL
jgi:hypothetical protein